MRRLRRIVFYICLSLAVLLVALVVSVFFFKDRIIRQFIAEANKQLNTPIKIGKFDVSILQNFPRISIVMTDVYVEDSHVGNYPLLTAKKLSFIMDAIEVYNGQYNIQGLSIEDSETNLRINAQGENNYTILKPSEKTSTQSAVKLVLEDVALQNTRVRYFDLRARQDMIFSSGKMSASIKTENDIYTIEADGQLTTDTISIEGKYFLNGKSFEVQTELVYDDLKKKVSIDPSALALPNASFVVKGTYEWKQKSLYDLEMTGENTDIQTILSLLPENFAGRFHKYKSKGEVYFTAKLKGELTKRKSPGLFIDFGFTNAVIYHPELKTSIDGATMKGSFSATDVSDLSKAELSLKGMRGRLNENPFTGELYIRDFNNPYIDCKFKGRLDASAVHGFYPIKDINKPSGVLVADVSLKGKIELLKKKETAQQVTTQGTIDLEQINLLYGKSNTPLKDLTGNLQFSNNDLALSNVSGKFGHTDFLLNGFFKNIITFLLFENQPVGIETDLRSEFLDLDELFDIAYASGEGDKSTTYTFDISKNVYLNFNCDVKALDYKRFKGRNIKGDLLVKNKVAVSRKLALQTMGGNLTLSGIVDSNNPKAIDVVCTSRLNGISLDSVFYVFENFDQTFIQDKHLKGDVTADVNFELTLNQNLRLFPETLVADIGAVIKKGELNNFEPMKKLNKYLDDEGLSRLRFSDLKNDIHIENKTVYIPQMQINSNVTSIRVSGTHTFDQRIDYRIVTPLRGRRSVDSESSAAVGLDEQGQTRLFLKITGTTDEYKIQYDTESVKKKILTDIKNEVKELKDAFRKKDEQRKKEIELQEDEYFEWSE